MKSIEQYHKATARPAGAIALQPRTPATAPLPVCRVMGGLLVRRERWGVSWRGWLALACLGLVVAAVLLKGIYPFLAVTSRASGEYLVVEGWVPADGLMKAYAEFRAGSYLKILTTGTATHSEWDPKTPVTYAQWAASKYSRMGISNDVVEAVPCWVNQKDRTYHSALALREWLREKGGSVKSIDVVSEGPHARRTRLLFEKALGPGIKVGIISIEDKEYDPMHWWRSSEGVRDVIGETIAYVYARVFFHPADQ